ncbi:MAG: recombinase family protein [Petrimonas sp.]|nr:recombinase family protein [Petrimonas sp.]
MSKEIKNVIIYCRVSSDEQALGGSLDFQEQSLRTYCDIKKYNIVGESYREDHSAKNFNRPKIQEIMNFCKKNRGKVDAVLFTRWDRYSRNLELALGNIRYFSNLGIEVNASENPLNLSIPENKMLLTVYLVTPEIDNDKRAEATKDGIIQAKRNGRRPNKAPRGYVNKTNNKGEKYVEMDEDKAKYIRLMFNEVAKGIESASYIRRKFARHGFYIAESTFLDMLRNRFYMGDVFVPAYKGEKAEYVKGQHEAMIQGDVFWKVQEVLDGKKKHTPKLSKRINPDLFLRKYIVCPVCGSPLTGATSRGNGGQYTYYNCSKKAKHFRVRAEQANEQFARYMASLKPNETVLQLYNEVLQDLKTEKDGNERKDVFKLEKELQEIQININKVDDKFVRDEIDKSTHNRLIERYQNEKVILQERINLMKNPNRANIEPKLRYSISLINNIDDYIRDAKVEVKCKLIGSMFPEKITFDGKSYRTNSYNSVLDLIYKQTNQLKGDKKEIGERFNSFPDSVPRAGIEPAWK